MKDWNSAVELQFEDTIYFKLVHAMAGVFVWELITSLDFEWDVISGRKKFRWPLTIYFLSRYVLLSTITGMIVALDTTREVDCQALYSFIGFAGQASIGLPTLILAIRTMALWSMNQWVVVPVTGLILGQWYFIAQGAIVKATYVDGTGCVLSSIRIPYTAASFIYAVSINVIIGLLALWKLIRSKEITPTFSYLMFNDGLLFYILVVLANIPAAIVVSLNLNNVMNTMLNTPASVFTTIVCGRAVRKFSNRPLERRYPTARSSSGGPLLLSAGGGPSSQSNGRSLFSNTTKKTRDDTQLDTFLFLEERGTNLSNLRYPRREK